MARRSPAATAAAPRTKKRAAPKPTATRKRAPVSKSSGELEAARKRIRDLEELHRTVGQRLDAAIATIHKILGRAA